jgi:hypothetical protein
MASWKLILVFSGGGAIYGFVERFMHSLTNPLINAGHMTGAALAMAVDGFVLGMIVAGVRWALRHRRANQTTDQTH